MGSVPESGDSLEEEMATLQFLPEEIRELKTCWATEVRPLTEQQE